MQREFIRCVYRVNTGRREAFKEDIYGRPAKKDRKCRGLVRRVKHENSHSIVTPEAEGSIGARRALEFMS